ncbi:MAG TPA: hypothetical protein VM010_00020, partial [Chitinophagaceae bacterium]|nr:hypothetical protein [Chitinophagaceae bacterium]
MQRPLHKNHYSLKLLVVILFSGLLTGCHKEDHFPPKANVESADVVYQWYKLLAKIQLLANPQPVVILNNRNFGFIGVGLYEAVRPGIKDAVSLSSKLYKMPEMPQPEPYNDYSWSAAANAVLASMSKQILAGLSVADKATIDSMENATNDRLKLSISDAALS